MPAAGFCERLLNVLVTAERQRMRRRSVCAVLGCSQAALRHAVAEINARQLAEIGFHDDEIVLRLSLPLLDIGQLRRRIGAGRFGYIPCLDSTQGWVNRHLGDPLPDGFSLFGECQTGGRGRYGRRWFSPLGRQFIMSQYYRFRGDPDDLSGMTAKIGDALAGYLNRSLNAEIWCKRPNDIFYRRGKLGGILTELVPFKARHHHLMIGVGLNLRLPLSLDVGQPCANVYDIAEIDRTPFTFSIWRNVRQTVSRHLETLSFSGATRKNFPAFLNGGDVRWDSLSGGRRRNDAVSDQPRSFTCP